MLVFIAASYNLPFRQAIKDILNIFLPLKIKALLESVILGFENLRLPDDIWNN